MSPVLVDSSVLLDVLNPTEAWHTWAVETLRAATGGEAFVINPLIYAEVSVGYRRKQDLDAALPAQRVLREPLPWDAAFLAGKAFLKYRRGEGTKTSPLPDFYIGAHAAVAGYRLLTRDPRRFRSYFPAVELITPE